LIAVLEFLTGQLIVSFVDLLQSFSAPLLKYEGRDFFFSFFLRNLSGAKLWQDHGGHLNFLGRKSLDDDQRA